MKIVPLSIKQANAFIKNKSAIEKNSAIGVMKDNVLIGVAIIHTQKVFEVLSEFITEREGQDKEKKLEKLGIGIRNAFRIMRDGKNVARLKNISELKEEQFKRLKEEIIKRYGNKCALCGKELTGRDRRFFEVYELEDIEVNGEKKKKIVLTDVELLCGSCYTLKLITLKKFKTGRNSNFYTNVMNKKLSLDLTKSEFEAWIEQEEKARKEIEKDIKQIDYRYLIDNGYIKK